MLGLKNEKTSTTHCVLFITLGKVWDGLSFLLFFKDICHWITCYRYTISGNHRPLVISYIHRGIQIRRGQFLFLLLPQALFITWRLWWSVCCVVTLSKILRMIHIFAALDPSMSRWKADLDQRWMQPQRDRCLLYVPVLFLSWEFRSRHCMEGWG